MGAQMRVGRMCCLRLRYQHAAGSAHGFFAVDMRRGAKRREHVEIVDDAPAQISVEVETGGDETVFANQLASRRYPIALGVQHAIDEHGAVHGEINAVEREQSFQALQEFGFQLTVSC